MLGREGGSHNQGQRKGACKYFVMYVLYFLYCKKRMLFSKNKIPIYAIVL